MGPGSIKRVFGPSNKCTPQELDLATGGPQTCFAPQAIAGAGEAEPDEASEA